METSSFEPALPRRNKRKPCGLGCNLLHGPFKFIDEFDTQIGRLFLVVSNRLFDIAANRSMMSDDHDLR